MRREIRTSWVIVALSLSLLAAACTTDLTPEALTSTPTGMLTPFLTATPSRTPAAAVPRMSPTPVPQPSATPFTYTIARGDTLLAIAFRFGVTVEEIVTVNPGINPRILSVGSELIIPIGEGGQVVIPSPTPVPVVASDPFCRPTADQGLWCFLLALNEQPRPIESLSAQITLFTQSGEVHASQEAFPPLNLIPPGKKLPLVAFFPPPIPENIQVHSQLKSSYVLTEEDERYLSVSVEGQGISVGSRSSQAIARGLLRLDEPEDISVTALVWVAAVAYGPDSDVVGLRRWEREVQVEPGEEIPFEIRVFSMGPPIVAVELFAEARRLGEIEEN